MGTETTPQFPKIVFSGLDPSNPGTDGWDSARAQVMDAVLSHGFFEAVFDKASPVQRDELYGTPLEELFGVPLGNKMSTRNIGKRHESYVKGPTFEILIVKDPASSESAEEFTHLMWPQGNPSFSKTVEEMSKPLSELELIVRKMIFEGFGIDKYYESNVKSTRQILRLARYEPPMDQESMINMTPHTDMNLISIVYQHKGEGLEILTHDGHWLHAQPNTFTVLVADTLKALTNGRVAPNFHRVKMPNNDIRYSVGFGSHVLEGFKIEAPEELVDEEHPKLYKPFEYEHYMQYCFTEEGRNSPNALKDYCGIGDEKTAV